MVISIISDKADFDRRIVCLPERISWQFETRKKAELFDEDEIEGYTEYELHLTTSDGLEVCLFHSGYLFPYHVTDEELEQLFNSLMIAISLRMSSAMAQGDHLIELGPEIDSTVEIWTRQLEAKARENPTQ